MGNEFHHKHHHHHRSCVMLMLCLRPSTNDDRLSKWDDGVVSFSDHDKFCNEPVSPRVGCVGQIKRNNKVIGFPSHHRSNNSGNNKNNKYFKLNKIFSSKNLISNSSCRREMIKGGSGTKFYDKEDNISISVVDLDPPLPVIKPVPRVGTAGGAVSIWKRRCGGEDLKALQLQQRHLPCAHESNSLS